MKAQVLRLAYFGNGLRLTALTADAVGRKTAFCLYWERVRLRRLIACGNGFLFVGAAHTRKGQCPLTHVAQAYGLLGLGIGTPNGADCARRYGA